MSSKLSAGFCLLSLILASVALGQDPSAKTGVAVNLAPGEPASKQAPRYSPPGKQFKLEAKSHDELEGSDHLETRLKLGPHAKSSEGHLLVLARSERDKPYDLLFVDSQGSGELDKKPIKIASKVIRNKTWSSFEATVQVNHSPMGEASNESYPVALWMVVDNPSDRPDVIRVSRRGFLSGSIKLGETLVDVVLSDSNNDAVFGNGDWWELRVKEAKPGDMRSVGDFAWANGKAWMLKLEGTQGRQAKLVAFDPGITEEQDAIKRDHYREDRLAPKADKPTAFRKDVDLAIKDAIKNKTPYFLKFETDWCGPCKLMTQFVFSAKTVADASNGIACIVVDGDVRKDLTEKHSVAAYPTGVLFDPDGKEIARYVGYQNVKETTAFLKKSLFK